MNYPSHLLFLATIFVFFVPLEHFLPRDGTRPTLRRLWKTDALFALVGVVLTSLLATGFMFCGFVLLHPLVGDSVRQAITGQPLWLQVLEVIVLADLWYYSMHRLAHTVPVLWKFHAVHHSIEELDWLASFRVHPVDQMLTGASMLLVPIVLGFTPEALVIFAIQFKWHSILKHSNVRFSWPWLRWVLVTPTFHHWHHANQKEAYDHNFAGQLPIMDMLFGTAILKEAETPHTYGTDDPVPEGFAQQLAYPFRAPQHAAQPDEAAPQPTG